MFVAVNSKYVSISNRFHAKLVDSSRDHFKGYHKLTSTYERLIKPMEQKFKMLKSECTAENFICRLSGLC